LDDSIGNGGGIKDPAPGGVLGNEAADYRTNSRTKERSKAVDSNTFSTLFWFKTVRKNTSTNLNVVSYFTERFLLAKRTHS
jgi:hypothetical protein